MLPKFVDRKEALRIIGTIIGKLRHGIDPEQEHILSFYGVAGIGKSWLLKHILDYYSHTHPSCDPAPAGDRGTIETLLSVCPSDGAPHSPIPCADVDFSKHEYDDQEHGYINFLEGIIVKLRGMAPAEIDEEVKEFVSAASDVRKELAKSTKKIASGKFELISLAFASIIQKMVHHHRAVLLLIDKIEADSAKVLGLFTNQVLLYLRKEWGFVVIMAGAKEFTPEEMGQQIKDFLGSWQLHPFSTPVTQEQLTPDLSSAAEQVQLLTQGHPQANDYVLSMYKKAKGTPPDQWVEDSRATISKDLATQVVYNYILQSFPQETRDVLLKIAVARRVEVSMFTSLLEATCYPDCSSSPDRLSPLKFFGNLESVSLAQVVRGPKRDMTWVLEPSVRSILAVYLLHYFPDSYKKLHETALQKHERWIISHPIACASSIVEGLYHQACLLAYERKDITIEELARELEKTLRQYLVKVVEEVNKPKLHAIMQSDTDLRRMLGNKLDELIAIV